MELRIGESTGNERREREREREREGERMGHREMEGMSERASE